jgi:hypothetical protein
MLFLFLVQDIAMPWRAQASKAVDLADAISLAGFRVITIGRFWVIAAAQQARAGGFVGETAARLPENAALASP